MPHEGTAVPVENRKGCKPQTAHACRCRSRVVRHEMIEGAINARVEKELEQHIDVSTEIISDNHHKELEKRGFVLTVNDRTAQAMLSTRISWAPPEKDKD